MNETTGKYKDGIRVVADCDVPTIDQIVLAISEHHSGNIPEARKIAKAVAKLYRRGKNHEEQP